MKRSLLATLLSLTAVAAQAQAPAQRIAFIGCPLMRNTPPVPCWLGRFQDRLYYLGPQGDLNAAFYPPQFNHRMLVEGTVTNAPMQCGGLVLKDVKVSVLPDLDPTCNVILPAEGWTESDKIRAPGPSGHKGEPPEGPRLRAEPAPFSAPFTAKTFTAPFDADTERLWREAQGTVSEAARYAQAAKARTITVTGYRAAIRLSDGTTFTERTGLAEDRAKAVEQSLRNLPLPAGAQLKVAWVDKPASGSQARRVTIAVAP